jgi:GNAT superfamily N-acetyltransferase
MSGYTSRPYVGFADLVRMEEAVSAAQGRTWWHIGDVAWAVRDHAHLELTVWVRLWHDSEGKLAGWTWLRRQRFADVFVVPGLRDPGLLDEMVAALEEVALRAAAAGDALEHLTVHADEDNDALRDALARRGFTIEPVTFEVTRRPLDDVEAPALPSGYRLSGVGDDLIDGRVEAQRAAFAPSTLTRHMYERVRRTHPYRSELDRVVVTDGGEVVAFCTAWLDERTHAGLLEPVGTHPAHQRRGLGTACCLDALRSLGAAGATTAPVSCESGSPGCSTYRAAGFAHRAASFAIAGRSSQAMRPQRSRWRVQARLTPASRSDRRAATERQDRFYGSPDVRTTA